MTINSLTWLADFNWLIFFKSCLDNELMNLVLQIIGKLDRLIIKIIYTNGIKLRVYWTSYHDLLQIQSFKNSLWMDKKRHFHISLKVNIEIFPFFPFFKKYVKCRLHTAIKLLEYINIIMIRNKIGDLKFDVDKFCDYLPVMLCEAQMKVESWSWD